MMPSLRIAVSVGVLLGALTFLQLRTPGEAVPIRRSLTTFPDRLAEWQGREATLFDLDVLNVLRVKDYLMRRYQDPGGHSLWLYIGYWDTQRKGAQPHSPQNCLPGAGWEPLEASRLTVPLGQGGSLAVNRYVIQKDRAQQVVLYWYLAQGAPVAGEIEARLAMIRNSILHHRTDGALIRVSSPVYGSVPDTTALLVRYVQRLHPVLGDYLPT